MILLELLIVLFTQLVATFGMAGAILIVCAGAVAVALLVCYITNWLVNQLTGFGGQGSSRRERKSGWSKDAKGSKKAKRLAEMGDEALESWSRKNPKDVDAVWELCRRREQKGDMKGYADCRERLLEMDSELDVSQRAAYSHQLADLCLGPLQDTARARRILERFVDRFPRSEEAFHTRKRLQRIADAVPQTPALPAHKQL